jgi:four helix bundle protein
MIEKFEDILAWQKAKELALAIYRSFELVHDFGFRDQLQRAAVSTMNNIAEGFERRGDREFKKFLYIAKGSCGEIRSMLHLASELKYLSKNEVKNIYDLSLEVSRLISGFIKKLKP